MERNNDVTTLYLAGDLALIALGAGLIMVHPDLRRSLMPLTAMLPGLLPSLGAIGLEKQLENLGNGKEIQPLKVIVETLLPDIERYIRAKAM